MTGRRPLTGSSAPWCGGGLSGLGLLIIYFKIKIIDHLQNFKSFNIPFSIFFSILYIPKYKDKIFSDIYCDKDYKPTEKFLYQLKS